MKIRDLLIKNLGFSGLIALLSNFMKMEYAGFWYLFLSFNLLWVVPTIFGDKFLDFDMKNKDL